MTALWADPYDAGLVQGAPAPLAEFNRAGVLAPADVHVALRLARLTGTEVSGDVLLAVALAVRSPRLGHVLADLDTIAETARSELEEPVDLAALPWPVPAADWVAAVAASPLVAVGDDPAASPERPLRLVGSSLYLDRYWREERAVAADLTTFADAPVAGLDEAVLADGLARLFPPAEDAEEDAVDAQRVAAEVALRRRLAVVAGGPGTGKTTTVARIVALIAEQALAAGGRMPLVALAAPTGKAQARLEESVQEQAAALPVADPVREYLAGLHASTLHRLLGWRPGNRGRFRHHRANRLPHDVVIVDETSMVSLSMMARLAEAVRPDARLVLVGDPGQLTSIEAGAVLGDIVGGGSETGGVVVLERVHRFGAGIAAVATAIRAGDADATLAALRAQPEGVRWIERDAAEAGDGALAPVRSAAVAAGRDVVSAARAGDGAAALKALGDFRLLCAHRRGDHGVAHWTAVVERWLAGAIDDYGADGVGGFYLGRPLLVTENDEALRLYNGDTGVIVAAAGGDGVTRAVAAFARRSGIATFPPSRLGGLDAVHAMTVHKSQGSQFGTAAVLLPPATSQILTRELLYTAVTRAQGDLILVGTEATIRAAVARPVARASGLAARLWGDP